MDYVEMPVTSHVPAKGSNDSVCPSMVMDEYKKQVLHELDRPFGC